MRYKIGDRVIVYDIDEAGDELLIVGTLVPVKDFGPGSDKFDFGIDPEEELSNSYSYGYEGIVNIFKHNIVGYASRKESIEKNDLRNKEYYDRLQGI